MEDLLHQLSALATALDSASSVLPAADSILPPQEGISLLNVKNDLFLSYLQHLTFLLLLKLRQSPNLPTHEDPDESAKDDLAFEQEDIVKKLVELRIYLEKGVRPLEGRLKYQIDKVVKAAEDADRASQYKSQARSSTANGSKKAKRRSANDDSEDDGSDGGEEGSQDGSEDAASQSEAEIDELSYRPNPTAFRRAAVPESVNEKPASKDGIYRPPHIAPALLPETRGREERKARGPAKSATIDEFIAHELSTAPLAEPSIGSTITAGGRRTKSRKEREEEAERLEYEESNLVRLPKQSKKDLAKAGHSRRDNFGGEDWRELGAGLNRINRLTQKKGGSGGALERSRKRAVEDGPRGDGTEFGRMFEKKRRTHSRNRR